MRRMLKLAQVAAAEATAGLPKNWLENGRVKVRKLSDELERIKALAARFEQGVERAIRREARR
jgi:hypothetical protein